MKLKTDRELFNTEVCSDFGDSLTRLIIGVTDGSVSDDSIWECSRIIYDKVYETAIQEIHTYFKEYPPETDLITEQDNVNCIYSVDGDVDPSEWSSHEDPDPDAWPRPNAGYGSSFTTWDDLVAYWFAAMGDAADDQLACQLCKEFQKRELVKFEPEIQAFVCSYKLYGSELYLQILEEIWPERVAKY